MDQGSFQALSGLELLKHFFGEKKKKKKKPEFLPTFQYYGQGN